MNGQKWNIKKRRFSKMETIKKKKGYIYEDRVTYEPVYSDDGMYVISMKEVPIHVEIPVMTILESKPIEEA